MKNPERNHLDERLAVVILNWNGEEFLRSFLPGVVRLSEAESTEVRVVVVDNASLDGSLAYLRSDFGKEVKIIELDANYGFTGGYNRGLAALDEEGYDYFLLLNSDIEVTENWLEPLVETMRRDRTVAAVMPKIKSFSERDRFEYAGACGGFIDLLGYPFCRGRILNRTEEDRGQYDTAREVFWTTGAAMLVRASVYRELGGLDDHLFAHMEEIDLCWRMKRKGWKCMVEPASVVYHVGGGTLPAWSPAKTYLNFRNNLVMLYKNLKPGQFAGVYLLRFGTDLLRWLTYAVRWRWDFAGAVFRGHRDFWRMRGKCLRNKEYGYLKLSKKNGFYPGVIVLRYLFGRRSFGNMM